MSIRKEEVYKLVDEMNEKETILAYNILKKIIKSNGENMNEMMEADNSPLDEEEKAAIEEIEKEETVNWESVKRELNL